MFENLGIIVDRKNNPVNHRSVLKVVCNPFLRVFGYQFATELQDDNQLGKVVFTKCNKINLLYSLKQKYPLKIGQNCVKERVWF